MTKLEKSKQIVKESVEFYLDGSGVDEYEVGTPEEGTGLSFAELIHPSGDSVEDMINEIEDWDEDDLYELRKYEAKVYAEKVADMLTERYGKEHSAVWDADAVKPFSRTYGAWVIERDDEDEDEG